MTTPAERAAAKKKPRGVGPARARRWKCGVRLLRESMGLSLRDVERETGVSNATLSHVERGCDTTLRTALRLAAFFGVPVEVLWAPANKGKKKP